MDEMKFKQLIERTCVRLAEEIGEPIVHGQDVRIEMDGDKVRYTSLSERGYRALVRARAQITGEDNS